MSQPSWSLQDAKDRFSAVIDAAMAGEPQLVTRHGKRAVVVVAAEEFERLRRLDRVGAPTFADLLLAIPQDDGEPFGHPTVQPRDAQL